MKIGYIRVSTLDQNNQLQEDALNKIGVERHFFDKASGKNSIREGLSELKTFARKGDTVCVWRLDRLGRSLKDLIEWINYFEENEISLISVTENIDTSSPTGKLIFHIFGALAEFERNLIIERTKAGLEAARVRGRRGGRPKKLSDTKIKLLNELYNKKEHSINEICEVIGISKPTLYRYLNMT